MILMMGMDYPAKVSIALTYLFLAGGCLATIWKNASRRNPKTGKTFIKLDLIMLTQPIMSSGALFGVTYIFYEIGHIQKLFLINYDNCALHCVVCVPDI
jgi:hypothetical protein